MFKKYLLLSFFSFLFLFGCSTTKKADSASTNIEEELTEKNRGNIPLLTRIRQLPGITTKNGVPVLIKASNSLNSLDSGEPLYVLNGQVIGNSFRSINQLVDNFNVKKVDLISGSEAATYGAQGAKGVIKITTFK